MLIPKQDRTAASSYPGPRTGTPAEVARLKVALIEIVPPIWRRVTIPVNLTLRRLHAVLLSSMGWKGA
ncbi:MAG TPA: hypothetical protein VGO79_03110, partial [Thermoanaerobaculia bacterium]